MPVRRTPLLAHRVDSNKCISYLTIELKEQIPEEYRNDLGEWMYGCDICQDVCPWNNDAKYTQMGDLFPREKILDHDINFWKELDNAQYDELFEGSAIRRAKFEKYKDNVGAVAKNIRTESREHICLCFIYFVLLTCFL